MRAFAIVLTAAAFSMGCGDSDSGAGGSTPEPEVLLEGGLYVVSESEVVSAGCEATVLESLFIEVGENPRVLTLDAGGSFAFADATQADNEFSAELTAQFEVTTEEPEPCVIAVTGTINARVLDTQTFAIDAYTHTISLVSGPTAACEAAVQADYPGFTAAEGCTEVLDVTMVRESGS